MEQSGLTAEPDWKEQISREYNCILKMFKTEIKKINILIVSTLKKSYALFVVI